MPRAATVSPARIWTPGEYALTIRAVGYDLVDPGPVEVTTGAPATHDLTLQTTTDLPSQLSSLEWAMSMSGTPEQKGQRHPSAAQLRLLPHL